MIILQIPDASLAQYKSPFKNCQYKYKFSKLLFKIKFREKKKKKHWLHGPNIASNTLPLKMNLLGYICKRKKLYNSLIEVM